MENQITNLSHLQDFLIGGKAEFTLENEKSGNHYTFRIVKKTDKYFPKTGSPNFFVHSNEYLGLFYFSDFPLKIGIRYKSSREEKDNHKWRIIQDFLMFIYLKGKIPNGINIYHNGRCSKCGRILTDPESINSGTGPTCRKTK